MTTKSKKGGTKKRDKTDFTLIELRKTTVAKLKEIQSELYTKQGKSLSYDKLVNQLIGQN